MARSNVTFYLGPAPAGAGLSARQLTITRYPGAGDVVPLSPYYNTSLGGTVEFVSVPLTENKIWQAKLVDTKTSGEVREPQLITFNTGSSQFPGPKSSDSVFAVYAIEDLSSSSQSSINSSSSSASSVSSSQSSSSSSSRSSLSSVSSINSSSSSASSINSSSSSASSINSSSSSSSLSSSSSVSVSSNSSSASSSS